MTPLDLLDTFDGTTGKIALVATYDFDPLFFERRVLRKKGFAGADRILVLMDAGRYAELVDEGLPVSGFNRRYLVAPIDRHPYVFHPKLYLMIGERRVAGVVGSNNCTNAGLAYNMELCSAFAAEPPDQTLNSGQWVLRQIFQAIRAFAADAPGFETTLQKEFFLPVERQHPWLAGGVTPDEDQKAIELLHSHQGRLWPELKKRLAGKSVKKITILAPFYDRDLRLLNTIKTAWPDARLSIFAQQKYATLEGKRLAALLYKKDRLFAVTPPAGRRLHAKALAFETAKETFWLTGSANATEAAVDGGNTESVLWFSSEETAETLFKDDALTIEAIDPAKFEAGPGEEPNNEYDRTAPVLELESATLNQDGSLELGFEAPASVCELTVRIKNFNESQPFLSLHVGSSAGRARLELSENQIAQIRGAALCELKGMQSGREVTSNKAALVQLHELLKEHEPATGSSNRKRKISETGEELVAHLDTLGTVREAVEFLDHCSIRFEDGETSDRGMRKPNWKPRDPFVADIPTQWLSEPFNNTAESLKEAVWRFVTRHQDEKLQRHIRRGNLNGLPNFLDIFRTLNGLLITFNRRKLNGVPIMPHPYVVHGIRTNLDLLMGNYDTEGEHEAGFVDAINANVRGDWKLVQERLQTEHVPQILRAAADAMIAVRRAGTKPQGKDTWSADQLKRVSDWIARQGLSAPSAEEVRLAGAEYMTVPLAA